MRALRITYGSLVASSTLSGAKLTLVELHRFRMGFQDFSVSFSALLTTTDHDPANWAAAVAAVEAAYATPYQRVLVEKIDPASVAAAATLLDLKHSDASGLEIEAEVSKDGSEEHDSAWSRLYTVTISGQLPAPSGVRSESYDLARDASCRRTLTVRGTYTATDGVSASTQAATKIATKAAALLLVLSGSGYADNWKLEETSLGPVSTNDLVAEIEHVWRERIFPDSASVVNDPRMKDVELVVTRSREATTGDREERGLATMTASYSAAVCHTATTDLRSLYEELRPWIVANMRLAAPGSFFALIRDEPSFDHTANRISATLVALTSTGGNLLEVRRVERLSIQHGWIVADVWDEAANPDDEQPTPAYAWPGPKLVMFTQELTRVLIGTTPSLQPAAGSGGAQPAANASPFAGIFGVAAVGSSFLEFLGPEGGAAVLALGAGAGAGSGAGVAGQVRGLKVSTDHSRIPGVRGLPGDQFDVTEESTIRTTRFVRGVGSGGGGAQPAANTTRTR